MSKSPFLLNQKGMNIFGQGPKIIRFSIPFLLAAILLNIFLPEFSALPESLSVLKIPGIFWLIAGIILWTAALVQLLIFFPEGKLVKNGCFGVCRNPIYSSYIVFIFPGITMVTQTWVYLVPALVMYIALRIFIINEENDLIDVFGQEYRDYMTKVPRTLPVFRKW